MDNLTHSLTGALLGQMGLKRLSGRAMATLVIAANIPDIDAVATVLGRESLAIRRGITHGPLAMLLLPLILTAMMLLWERWRPNKHGQPVRAGPLLLLAYIGTLSHPALDWLNSYGIRLLEPFSSRWSYGDTLFIIDVWVWAALIIAFVVSRWREKRGGDWRRPAWFGFLAIALYILANGLITARAESITRDAVEHMVRVDGSQPTGRWLYRPGVVPRDSLPSVRPDEVVANPVPLTFWRRTMLWRGDGLYGSGDFDAWREWDSVILEGAGTPIGLDDPRLAAEADRSDVRAFLFWSRMPIVTERNGRAFLADQRFNSSLTRDQFLIPLNRPSEAP